MRYKLWLALGVIALLAAVPALAQSEFTGNLFVTVKDDSGQAITGATVKLNGPDFTRESSTDNTGRTNFIKLFPGTYELEVSASGYNTNVVPEVAIESLANPEMIVTLSQSTTQERVVVKSTTPLLDKRKTGTTTIVNADEITQIPTARDPWSVLSTIPGITTDRINVAGNESGQQSVFAGKGDSGAAATWVMDGVEFTDNAAEGASSTYMDFNAFENIGFVTGGADIEQITPGLRLNFVTKQGTNRHSGTVRLLFTDVHLQEDLSVVQNPQHVIDAGGSESFSGNGINEVFEKNFDIGGPVLKDWLWYWAGYTQNDIDIQVGDTPDRTKLQNTSIKLHGQATGGRTNYRAWYTVGDKVKDGRGASPTRPLSTTWDQKGPSPIYSGSISQFFGSNLELSLQWGVSDGGFQLAPKGGDTFADGSNTQIVLDEFGVWQHTFFNYVIDRPVETLSFRGNYFLTTGNWEHEFKFGFRYKETERETVSHYGGDQIVAFQGTGGLGGTANFYRDGFFRDETEHTNLWIGDTVLNGPWAITAGVNWSMQEGTQKASLVPGNTFLEDAGMGALLPDLVGEDFDPGVEWDDMLPRVGVTYTFPWERRLLLRASYSQFVDQLSNADVGYGNPVGPAYLAYSWDDLNLDALIQEAEIDFAGGPIAASNVDPNNPGAFTRINQINSDLEAPKVDELIIGGEYELMRNFTVGANLTWRERENDLHTPLFNIPNFNNTGQLSPLNGGLFYNCVDPANVVSGDLPGTSTPYMEQYCVLSVAGLALTDPLTRNTVLDNRPGYTQEYQGIELFATKRLSNRWLMRAFVSFNSWDHEFSGQPLSANWDNGSSQIANTIFGIDGDPTNTQGGTAVDGGQIGYPSGGSGSKDDIWVGSATWQANANFMYQLPYGFTIATNIQAREGYMVPYYHQETITEADGFTQRKQIQIGSADAQRYDDIFLVDLKAAKTFQLEGNTAVEVSLEAFNLFDDDTILQQGRRADTDTQFGNIREVLSPRIYRFGATVNF